MIDPVKVSERAKNQLITLKKRTGSTSSCADTRWRFVRAVGPPEEHIPLDAISKCRGKRLEVFNIYEQLWYRILADYPDAGEIYWSVSFIFTCIGISYLMADKQSSCTDLV